MKENKKRIKAWKPLYPKEKFLKEKDKYIWICWYKGCERAAKYFMWGKWQTMTGYCPEHWVHNLIFYRGLKKPVYLMWEFLERKGLLKEYLKEVLEKEAWEDYESPFRVEKYL